MKTKIVFVDLNKSLVSKVNKLGIESIYGDYFTTAYDIDRPVLMTASNPAFTFGGGIDYHFTQHFPKLCEHKQGRAYIGQERIANVIFSVTVNKDIRADENTVESALRFAISQTYDGETLVLSGIGTGIGGLSEDTFVEILKWVI